MEKQVEAVRLACLESKQAQPSPTAQFLVLGSPKADSSPIEALRVAVLLPCCNEELTVERVIRDFSRVLPGCRVFVYDNNSADNTAAVAKAAGAVVRKEQYQGKGNVVRRMFADIDAEVYFLVDGDDTYDADAAVDALTSLMNEGLDFVNIARVTRVAGAYRRGHRLGNAWLTGVVRLTFGHRFTDMLSGYKVFSRRFVKSFPALSRGFEIETELTIHALELRMPSTEIQAHYRERIEGSTSKLRTIRDGVRILALIIRLLRDERPLWFFGAIGVMGILAAIGLAVPVITTYLESGLVPRLPTALLSVGLILSGLQSIAVGLVLETVRTGRREARHLAYLRFCGPVLPD